MGDGSVRALKLPFLLKMPVIGLMNATRHKDTPVIRVLGAALRDALNQPARTRTA